MSSLYEKNIAALRAKDPVAAEIVETGTEPFSGEIVPAKNGLPTMRLTAGGAARFVHSAYDPRREAEETVSRLSLGDKNVIIFCGFGLGYHPEALLDKCPWLNTLLIVEPNPAHLRAAFGARDLTSLLASPKTLLLTGDRSRYFNYMLLAQGRLLTGNIAVEGLPALFDILPEVYGRARKHIADNITALSVNLNTTLSKGRLFYTNLTELLPVILHYPGINRLKDAFKGKPAICISSGPSLQKNIDLLPQLKGKAVLIAVDSVARVMLDRGIVPDIVCTVDYDPAQIEKFRGLFDGLKESYLVFDPETCPPSVLNFKGGIFGHEADRMYYHWLTKFGESKGNLMKGLCNSQQAYGLAVTMGCDPIVFIGQDLSYPWEGLSHIEGTDFTASKMVLKDEATGKLYFTFTEKHVGSYTREIVMVPGIGGQEVPTDYSMFSYLVWYKSAIPKANATVVQASEQGALIEGTEVMTLAEAMQRWCTQPLDVSSVLSAAQDHRPVVDWDGLRALLQKASADLGALHELAVEGCAINEKLLELFRTGETVQLTPEEMKLRTRSDQVKDKLMTLLQASELSGVIEYCIGSNVFLATRSENLPTGGLGANAKEYRTTERISIFFEGMKGGADFVRGLFNSILDNFENIKSFRRNDEHELER